MPRWSPNGPTYAAPRWPDRGPPAPAAAGGPTVQCLRCAQVQPLPAAGARTCLYCSAALPVQRWRADPPPTTVRRRAPTAAKAASYRGPPSYPGAHPRWGFPTIVWRAATVVDPDRASVPPLRALRVTAVLSLLTFLAAATAAGGELWRYLLLLRGRTEVLSGPLVVRSDWLVSISAPLAAGFALVTAGVAIPTLVRLHGAAARRAGLQQSRTPASVLARLVVPGWNVYGLGVVIGEIDGLLTAPTASQRPRLSPLVVILWGAWVFDAVLVLVTLGRAFGRSEQAVADTVELHIFLDLMGAVVALLAALVFRRFARLLGGTGAGHYRGWVVRSPEPTRGADRPAKVNAAAGTADIGVKAGAKAGQSEGT